MIHVDAPLLRSVAIELGTQGVDRYHAENGKFALKAAKAALARAKVRFDEAHARPPRSCRNAGTGEANR